MSFFDVFRAKRNHPDPRVRLAGVARLDDQEALADMVENDADESVRAAALQRLKDQELLARIAKSEHPFNTRALEALTDSRVLAQVARSARSAEVRRTAVGRIEDRHTLHQIATQDVDPTVRHVARAKGIVNTSLHDLLKRELSQLEIANRKAAEVATFCGALDDVCDALMDDRRFRIHGIVADETLSEPSRRHCVEMLASSVPPFSPRESAAPAETFFHIKVFRPEPNAFDCCIEEKVTRVSMS